MIFNFITWAARSPLKYYPYSSSGLFFHKGYYFRIVRERLQGRYGYTQESLHIMVLWPSTKPARALIEEARGFCVSESILQKEFDELVDGICLGNTEILRWGNLNIYREAEAGGGAREV